MTKREVLHSGTEAQRKLQFVLSVPSVPLCLCVSFVLVLSSARARSARNRSPLESTRYGFSHVGTLPRPTAVNTRVISLIGVCPSKQSMIARSSGQVRDS